MPRLLPISSLCALLLALAAGSAPALAHEGHEHAGGAVTHVDTPAELRGIDLAATVDAAELGAAPAGARAAAAGGDALPATWCGQPTTVDDGGPAAPHFKVVYAYAADQPDRFASWQDDIQGSLALVQRFVASQSGGRKALRLDMGTACGAGYVDVVTVRLPGARSAYLDDLGAVRRDVSARLAAPAAPRNVIVVADGLTDATYLHGVGEAFLGAGHDAPTARSHDRGGLYSVLWMPRGVRPTAGRPLWPAGWLHEMSHNLGAVQWSAPHSTMPASRPDYPYGHCWDGADVMCYEDGPAPAHEQVTACAPLADVITKSFDCGGDDYFNPAPAPGSYLASHWNLYDSAFLAPCATIAPACGATSSGRTPAPPVATAPPAVRGTAAVGQTLSASGGTWLNAPQTLSHRWQREQGGTWTDIPGATAAGYRVASADAGRRLRVRVLATNADGTAAVESASVGPVAAAATASAPREAELRVTSRRGRGRTLGSVRVTAARDAAGRTVLRATPGPVRLAAGRYELRACARAGDEERCAARRVRVRRAGSVRLPALAVRRPSGGTPVVTVRLVGLGRAFAARAQPISVRW